MSTDETKNFADRLQSLIAESGKPIKELAAGIGVSTGALSKYQNDAAVAGIDALVKISNYFHVSTDWLLGISEARKRDAEVRQVCNYTGLDENTIIELNMRKSLGNGKVDAIIEILDMIVQESAMISDLIWKAGISAFEAERSRGIEKHAGKIAAKMIAKVFSKEESDLDGMVSIPADDASFLYMDAATETVKSIVRYVIEESVTDYVNINTDSRRDTEK